MKNKLIGFIAIGLITLVGCEKDDDDTETTDSTETSSDDGSADTSDEGTDSSTDDDTTDTTYTSFSIEYGEGATDIDGNTYQSVIIGTQEWVSENLRTSKYSDGTTIPNVTNDGEWWDLTTGAWCHYDNDNQYDTIYGKLYNFYAVETGKLCPTGWHVPTDAEWTILEDYLTADGHSGTEGTALKATSGWNNKDDGTSGNGTDDYGWNGLPSGGRFFGGSYSEPGNQGFWWSSSKHATTDGYIYFDFWSGGSSISKDSGGKPCGFSVHCLRD